MKKKFVSFMLLMSSVMSMTAAVNVSRIEPTDWFVGMKDASLQLMVYGKDIKNAEVSVNYPGVKIDSVARLESPNYLLVYLNLKDAKAGEMVLNFKQGKQSKKVKYQLKDREMAGEKRMGFTNEDVLYMLMPELRPSCSKSASWWRPGRNPSALGLLHPVGCHGPLVYSRFRE